MGLFSKGGFFDKVTRGFDKKVTGGLAGKVTKLVKKNALPIAGAVLGGGVGGAIGGLVKKVTSPQVAKMAERAVQDGAVNVAEVQRTAEKQGLPKSEVPNFVGIVKAVADQVAGKPLPVDSVTPDKNGNTAPADTGLKAKKKGLEIEKIQKGDTIAKVKAGFNDFFGKAKKGDVKTLGIAAGVLFLMHFFYVKGMPTKKGRRL